MRTRTVETDGEIAVVAQNAEAFGEVLFDNPIDHFRTAPSNLTAMIPTAAFLVIQGEEFVLEFAATRALISVVIVNDSSVLNGFLVCVYFYPVLPNLAFSPIDRIASEAMSGRIQGLFAAPTN